MSEIIIWPILAWMLITVLCFKFLIVYPLLGFIRFAEWLEGMQDRPPIQSFLISIVLLWSGIYLIMLFAWAYMSGII